MSYALFKSKTANCEQKWNPLNRRCRNAQHAEKRATEDTEIRGYVKDIVMHSYVFCWSNERVYLVKRLYEEQSRCEQKDDEIMRWYKQCSKEFSRKGRGEKEV